MKKTKCKNLILTLGIVFAILLGILGGVLLGQQGVANTQLLTNPVVYATPEVVVLDAVGVTSDTSETYYYKSGDMYAGYYLADMGDEVVASFFWNGSEANVSSLTIPSRVKKFDSDNVYTVRVGRISGNEHLETIIIE